MGLLECKTKYSEPEMMTKYDNAHLVDKFLVKVTEKYRKNNGNDPSVHTMAEAIINSQDTSKEEFTLKTNVNEDGSEETVTVNKATGDIVGKKDNIIVRMAKGAYKGVKNFFSNIWKGMKRFAMWLSLIHI